MALMVSDVVENRLRQRAPVTLRDGLDARNGARSAADSRERFSLDQAAPQATARDRSSGTAATPSKPEDARRTETASTAARPQGEKPRDSEAPDPTIRDAKAQDVKVQDVKAQDGSAPDPKVQDPTPQIVEPQDPKSQEVKVQDPKGAASPSQEIPEATAETPVADPAIDPATRPEPRQAVAAKPATRLPAAQAQAQAGRTALWPTGPSASRASGASADAGSADAPPEVPPGVSAAATPDTAERRGTEVSPGTASAASPTLPFFLVAPQPQALSPLQSQPAPAASVQATARAGGTPEAEAGSEGSNVAPASGTTDANGTVAAETRAGAGFEAALAAAVPDGAGGALAASTGVSPGSAALDSAAGAATAAPSPSAPSPTAGAGSAAAVHPQAPTAGSTPSVPLGAVPMTIGLRALGASSRFEIRLDPKELGRIDVALDIDRDSGTVGARLVVDRPETLALLQRDAASLQQALSQTGLDASAGVSLSLRGGEGEGRRDGSDTGADAGGRNAGRAERGGRAAETDPTPIDIVPLRSLRGLGRVDIRI